MMKEIVSWFKVVYSESVNNKIIKCLENSQKKRKCTNQQTQAYFAFISVMKHEWHIYYRLSIGINNIIFVQCQTNLDV